MNFVKSNIYIECLSQAKIIICFFLIVYLFFCINGCSDKVILPSASQLVDFENAGPISPTIDLERLLDTKFDSSPYRLRHGEVLEITMPAILRVVTTDEPIADNKDDKYICRINEIGYITLPVIGEIEVAGKTLAQVEVDIIETYYPKYILSRPSVFIQILEYKTFKVSISGAVQQPGIYSLRSDQMHLVSLLMEAGGIIDEGAALIRIIHPKGNTLSKSDEKDELVKTRTYEASDPDSIPDNKDVHLSFKQQSTQSMNGILTITCENKAIFIEQLDISSEIERLVLLKQFSLKEPRISIIDIERKLCALAESLSPGTVISSKESNAYHNILNKIEEERWKLWDFHQKSIKQESKVFNHAAQQSLTSPKLLRQNDSLLQNSIRQAINSSIITNATLGSNYYKTNPVSDSGKVQGPNEILNLSQLQNQANPTIILSDQVQDSEIFILPVKGYNIPFEDVVLQDGDKIIVEHLMQPLFSVMGLVNKPGNFSYPPDVKYNLMQALAFAGGLDPVSEPRYATIYRLKSDGTIIHATFEIISNQNSSQLTDALNTLIKPGDIISIEHTPRTRTNVFLNRVFRLNIGTYFNINDAFDE